MTRLAIILSLALSASPAMAIGVAMSVAPAQQAEAWPLRTVRLEIVNDSSAEIADVSLRLREGGPLLRAQVTVAPKSTQEVLVNLPAISAEQTYEISLMESHGGPAQVVAPGSPGPDVRTISASIQWPMEWIESTRAAMIDPDAYHQIEGKYTTQWPSALRRSVLVTAILGCLAAGACLLVRRAGFRAVSLAVVFAGITLAMLWQIQQAQAQSLTVDQTAAGGLLVTSSRTTAWSDGGAVYPVYRNLSQMLQDVTTGISFGQHRGLSTVVVPEQPRLFGASGRQPPATSGKSQAEGDSSSSSSPASSGGSSPSSSSGLTR